MKARIPLNPDILRWARESANLPIEDVADRMKKDPGVIEDWERGVSSPTYVQLETLSYTIYKRPIAIFFFPEAPDEVSPSKSFRTLPESELEQLSPKFLQLFRRAQAMQANLADLNDGVNPAQRKIFRDLRFGPRERVGTMSRAVREYLGISLASQLGWNNTETAFKNWRSSLEENGIFVFKDAFKQDDISGFCLYDDEFPVIYVNNSMPFTRQIFTLFHELTHLLLRTGGIDKDNDAFLRRIRGDNRRTEILCNRFAGEFLVPEADFAKSVSGMRIDHETVRGLADRYKVSGEVILRKCLDKGLINQGYYEQKRDDWISEARKRRRGSRGGDYYRTTVAYLGGSYLNLVFARYYNGQLSLGQVAEYTGVKVDYIPGVEATLLGRGDSG